MKNNERISNNQILKTKYHNVNNSSNNVSWLTVSEAAIYIKCGKTKINELLSRGLIPYYRLDKTKRSKRLILKHDLNKYLLSLNKIRLTENEKYLLNIIN